MCLFSLSLCVVLEAGGFVIKSILKGSRMESDGQIHTGDHIVAVSIFFCNYFFCDLKVY